jgi:hypothetical protein
LFAIYFVETGLLLIVGPWTEWWSRNLFAQLLPWLQLVMGWVLTRLAVNLLGCVTAFAGLSEVWRLLMRRPYAGPSSTP